MGRAAIEARADRKFLGHRLIELPEDVRRHSSHYRDAIGRAGAATRKAKKAALAEAAAPSKTPKT